ncbi:unnamed protein product [Peniophora sp. CBMAI 1063]|nr:unnamed protein product [Peniophora sp. CBMAI 1063]
MPSWHMLNIDDREKADGVRGKFPEFIFDGHDWIVKLLAQPKLPSADSPEAVPKYYTEALNDKWHELGALSVLLPELIAIIFSHVEYMDDAACLAVTHRLLGYEGFRRAVELRRWEWYYLGRWRYARIITLGSGVKTLPKGLLDETEQEEMKRDASSYGLFYDMDKRSRWAAPFDMAWHYRDWQLKPALARISHLRSDELRIRLLIQDTSPTYAPQSTWALCNFDTREYIRAGAIANMKIPGSEGRMLQVGSVADGPFIRGKRKVVDLGTVAIILTAWPCYQSGGQWAGHRLEICRVRTLSRKNWKDVSRWAVGLIEDWARGMDAHLLYY